MKRKKIKKASFHIGVFLIAVLLLANTAFSWLTRVKDGSTIKVAGFFGEMPLKMNSQDYSITTSFKDLKGGWNEISLNYDKSYDGESFFQEDGTSKWFQGAVLVPGQRTEFRTLVKNTSDHEISITSYLNNVFVGEDIARYISMGTYQPESRTYEASEFSSVENGSISVKYKKATNLILTENCRIPVGDSVVIYWYIYTDANMEGGSFCALTDQDGNYITKEVNGKVFYYCVTDYNSDTDKILKAHLVDSVGNLVDSTGALVGKNGIRDPYAGSLEGCRREEFHYVFKYAENGASSQEAAELFFRIGGMRIMEGDS